MAAGMGNLIGSGSGTASESKPANMAEPAKPGVSYTIGGVKVDFPVKAYPSQISMMDKIIRGCHRAQNCLLESPTGSGKTLALLCGALAWQKAETKKLGEAAAVEHRKKVQEMLQTLQEENANTGKENAEKPAKSTENPQKMTKTDENAQKVQKFKVNEGDIQKAFSAPGRPKFKYEDESDGEEEDIFVQKKKMKTQHTASSSAVIDLTAEGDVKGEIKQIPELPAAADCPQKGEEPRSFEDFLKFNATPPPVRGPKIFFGTRTHKQIAQVLHELRRTAYSDVKSCILSSRNHSCIHEYANQPNVNRNDMCHDLLDSRTRGDCRFFHNVKRFGSHSALAANGIPTVWDLEDLTKFGREKTSCPYFMARELMLFSDIIFCPYNYLLDPMIRESMGISLKGNILILDEAHNIEDTCRDSASTKIAQDDVLEAMRIFEETAAMVACEGLYREMAKVMSSLSLWIDQHRGEVTDSDYNDGKWMMDGHQAVEKFEGFAFGKSNFHNFVSTFEMLEAQKNDEENADSPAMSGATKNLISGLILALKYLYDEKHTRDYHVVLTKSFSHQNDDNPVADSQGWFNMRKKRNRSAHWRYTLNFWCFNPAVVFEEVRQEARSVVLTSGTLSPMDSFQSELGANFPITLEANHVIDPSQCLIRSLGFGPKGVCLDGKFASTNTYDFQDEIGRIILQICSFVPHGILCFVSSYSLLDKLYERWSTTGTVAQISQHKSIVCEPRRSSEFEPTMKAFYETIERTDQTPVGQGLTGALFLAVCRGKVSEGLDFADKNARVIITIGIPYPNIRDSQVTLKKTYNDRHKISKGLLSGNDWYQIQAYRALNQALGRCIRHRNDWGAILLFDQRFSNNYYYKSLSKWVRNKVQHHSDYNDLIHQLNEFIQYRLQIDRQAK